MTDNLPIRAALALGITSSSLIAGINLSLSFVSIPSLLNTPNPIPTPALLTQWQQHYDIGKGYALPMVASSVASYAYGIYFFDRSSPRGQLLAAGIASIVAVPIFTLIWMEGPLGRVNTILHNLNAEVSARTPIKATAAEEGRVRGLLEHWAVLCRIRALFPLAASVIGIWASI